MDIDKTYSGMWSSDPARLKTLLDAGETVIGKNIEGFFTMTKGDQSEGYGVVVEKTYQPTFYYDSMDDWDWSHSGIVFLDPAPKPLEPTPLEWEPSDLQEVSDCGIFTFYVGEGHVEIWVYDSVKERSINIHTMKCRSNPDGKRKVQKWIAKQAKSMVGA